ncbi:uncharacterized protein LOC133728083 [Rosa rugosa]|uniref:uncharacterized protein LOC133728083 n=1 Tax=Rosa rugosa TaxID=74645 RepID=UPI002B413DEF|nr:uncharacterized protein LOC133728083 [Rosa rugosa]
MQNPFDRSRANACQWSLSHSVPDASVPMPHFEVKTFAFTVSDSVKSSINLSELTAPLVRGDKIYVKINDGPKRLVPLGKGYFDIHFSTEEDMRRIWGGGTCTLVSGIFCLSEWKPNFKPSDVMPQTHAQVTPHRHRSSPPYGDSSSVGTPLQLDRTAKESHFGYYSRVLVDVDLAIDLPTSVMVENESFCFPVEIRFLRHILIGTRNNAKLCVSCQEYREIHCTSNEGDDLSIIQNGVVEVNKVVDEQTVTNTVIQEPLIQADMVVSTSQIVTNLVDNNPYVALVNEAFERVAIEHIKCLANIVMNEPSVPKDLEPIMKHATLGNPQSSSLQLEDQSASHLGKGIINQLDDGDDGLGANKLNCKFSSNKLSR